MMQLIRAEYIKGRRSFGRKSLIIFPLGIALLAICLMGGQYTQIGAYNWWYMALLPMTTALLCVNLTDPEKKQNFFHVAILPQANATIWWAKIVTGCMYVFFANLMVFVLTSFSGLVFGSQFSVWQGMAAAVVLTVTVIWQIPLGMLLAVRWNTPVTFVFLWIASLICSGQDLAGGDLWFIPFSIPARLMAPIIWVNPNGIPLQAGSPLYDTGVILPGLLIAAILFVLGSLLTCRWFDRRSD